MTKSRLLRTLALITVATFPLKTLAENTQSSQEQQVYETRVDTVGCTNSMKAMRYANRGSVRANIGCYSFKAGERLYPAPNIRTTQLHPNRLIKLSNRKAGEGLFVGFFIGRDITPVE